MGYSPPGSSVPRIFLVKNRSGLPFPLPGDLPNTGIEPTSPEVPALQTDSSVLSHGGNVGGLALQNERHCKEQE